MVVGLESDNHSLFLSLWLLPAVNKNRVYLSYWETTWILASFKRDYLCHLTLFDSILLAVPSASFHLTMWSFITWKYIKRWDFPQYSAPLQSLNVTLIAELKCFPIMNTATYLRDSLCLSHLDLVQSTFTWMTGDCTSNATCNNCFIGGKSHLYLLAPS